MEARYATRKQQLLAECQVAPAVFDQVLPRLTTFMAPFVETFCRQNSSSMPIPLSVVCSRMWNAKISNRSGAALLGRRPRDVVMGAEPSSTRAVEGALW